MDRRATFTRNATHKLNALTAFAGPKGDEPESLARKATSLVAKQAEREAAKQMQISKERAPPLSHAPAAEPSARRQAAAPRPHPAAAYVDRPISDEEFKILSHEIEDGKVIEDEDMHKLRVAATAAPARFSLSVGRHRRSTSTPARHL